VRHAHADTEADQHTDTEADQHTDTEAVSHARTYSHNRPDRHPNQHPRSNQHIHTHGNQHGNQHGQAKAVSGAKAKHALHRESCGYAGAIVRNRLGASVLFHRAKRWSTRAISVFIQRAGGDAFAGSGRG